MSKLPKMSALDVQQAIQEIEAWKDGLRGRKLTWQLLEKVTGFSRQTLYSKGGIAAAYADAKKALTSDIKSRKSRSDDYLESKIEALEAEIIRYKALERDWLERWVRIAYHLQGKGMSISDVDRPLPLVNRK